MKIQQTGEFTGNIITTVLANRGIEDVDLLLNPNDKDNLDSSKLRNINTAAKVLIAHLMVDNHVGIIIDPDADGFTSASVIYQYIKKIHNEAKITLFYHEEKTHGLTNDIIEQVVESNVDLLIIPDAGSNDNDNIATLFYMGIETLIIDHHEIDNYPSQGILVNNQDDENEATNKNLVGVGMVYKFCEEMDKFFENKYADDFFDLVAIGQVGDTSDISDNEVRNYVFKGLREITNPFVKEVLKDVYGTTENITPMDLSFSIIPLINAVVRVGTMEDKQLLFRALNSIDADELWTVEKKKKNKKTGKFDKFDVVQNVYEYAYDMCKRNKTKQATLVKNALAKMNDFENQGGVIVSFLPKDTLTTISGLIANKIAQKHKKPTIVIKEIEIDGETKYLGSGRGYDKILPSLKDWCNATKLTEFAQGHANAFGILISKDNLNPFISCTHTVKSDEIIHYVDYISKNRVNKDIIEEIDSNRILFGGKVSEPVLAFTNIKVRKEFIRQKGSMLTFFDEGIEFVLFNSPAGLYDNLTYGFDMFIEMDFVGIVSRTDYSGVEKVRIVLVDCARSVRNDIETPETYTIDNIVF